MAKKKGLGLHKTIATGGSAKTYKGATNNAVFKGKKEKAPVMPMCK